MTATSHRTHARRALGSPLAVSLVPILIALAGIQSWPSQANAAIPKSASCKTVIGISARATENDPEFSISGKSTDDSTSDAATRGLGSDSVKLIPGLESKQDAAASGQTSDSTKEQTQAASIGDSTIAFLKTVIGTIFNPNERIAAIYLLTAIILAVFIWFFSQRKQSLYDWLLPRSVYTHRSNILDIKLFIANKFFGFIGLTGSVFFPSVVAYWLVSTLADPNALSLPTTWNRALLATFLIVVSTDFCKYWVHRWHHVIPTLWPFHAVHHSADVLTPLTLARVHPVESVIRNFVITIIVGLVQGSILYLIIGKIDIVTIGGANAFLFLFNAAGANLRHSHIWMRYGRVVEHIFISPAQHQIHHSVAPEHHDKNFGSMFAIWDWMFGTLYIPEKRESLRYGVADEQGDPIPQPHETLRAALVNPFVESWQALKKKSSAKVTSVQTGMTPGFSLWLDTLRAGAALTVLFGHMAHERFTRGDYIALREWTVAADSVIVFFVLSGAVIAYAAERDGSLGRFTFNRMTRVISVVLPALILTMLFDALGTNANKAAYPDLYYEPHGAFDMFWRGLTFSNEWQGLISDRLRLGTNGPLWSLSYEVAFYTLFSFGLFLRGVPRLLLIGCFCLFIGLPILALFPAWLIGVCVWYALKRGVNISPRTAWTFALGCPAALIALKVAGLPVWMSSLTASALAPASHHAILGYSDETLWNTIMAVFIALHLVGMHYVTTNWQTTGKAARTVRWIAGASFSLYVMHYPTLHLLDALLPEDLLFYDVWLLCITLIVCFGFATAFERPLKGVRRSVLAAWTWAIGSRQPQTDMTIS